MSYTPTEWATGDVVTAEKLNKAEEQIAENSSNIINLFVDMEHGTFNKDTNTKTISFIYPVIDEKGEAVSFNDIAQLLTEKVIKINMNGLIYDNNSGTLISDNGVRYSDILVEYDEDELEGNSIKGIIDLTSKDVTEITVGLGGFGYIPDPINETGNIYCAGIFKYLESN